MDTFLIILIIILLIGNAATVWLLWRSRQAPKNTEEEDQSILMLQQQMQELSKRMDERLERSTKEMQESVRNQFSESKQLVRDINQQVAKQMQEVTKGVTESKEASKQLFSIADQLRDLEQVMKHQKQRGNLGEASLELILSNILPPTSYKLQYRFEDGMQADAVIHTKEGIIPVDAKFSLDNYSRLRQAEEGSEQRATLEREFKNDLKKRIEETAKYIQPKENTLPFAFMFIPAEGIYYDLLVNEVGSSDANTRTLIDYAYTDKNVIIVSPTTFAAYLQSVLYGFRAFQIEESAKEIRKRVEELSRHIKQYDASFKKLGNSLSTTVGHYNTASKELGKIDKDVYRITGEGTGVDTESIERPEKQE